MRRQRQREEHHWREGYTNKNSEREGEKEKEIRIQRQRNITERMRINVIFCDAVPGSLCASPPYIAVAVEQ